MKENWFVECVLMLAVLAGFVVALAAVARLAVSSGITMGGAW